MALDVLNGRVLLLLLYLWCSKTASIATSVAVLWCYFSTTSTPPQHPPPHTTGTVGMLEAYILEREEREGHPQTRTASECLESLHLDVVSGRDTHFA